MSRISIIDVHIDHLVNARPANQRCFSFDLEKPTAKSPWSLFWADCITFIGVPRDGRYFCVLHVFLIKRKTRRDRMRAKFRATRYASRYTNQSPNKEMVGVRSCSVHAVPSNRTRTRDLPIRDRQAMAWNEDDQHPTLGALSAFEWHFLFDEVGLKEGITPMHMVPYRT
jgi:hypothetical protein